MFVAGQPGAGKTEIGDLVQAALARRGGAVRIGRDLYKAAHRRYGEFLAEDVRTAGVQVRPDTRWWQAQVEAYVRDRRFDAVVETALADADEFRAASVAYRRAGYWVEVVALATAEALSQLGTVDRFLENGQFVSWRNHDSCVKGMLPTLAVIEDEQLADRTAVVRRGMHALYSNEVTGGAWQRPTAAARVVAADRARWWSAQETAWFRRELARAGERLRRERLEEDRRLAVQRDTERAAALSEPVRRIAQARLDPPGVDYHRLSSEEHAWIFDELIVPSYGEIVAQEQPVAVYVMAQPGAGKSNAARLVLRALRERRPVRITGDVFKAAHPDYLRLLQEEPRTAGERIRADYRAWQTQAEAWVRERRGDAVIETAPASPQQFRASAAPFEKAGYRIEVVALAVRAANSRQGTFVRYAQASRGGLPARPHWTAPCPWPASPPSRPDARHRACPLSDPHDDGEGWPCYLAPGVEQLLLDPATDPQLFSAVLAVTFAINEHRGDVPGATASQKWPQQRRLPLGPGGELGLAEYVIVADADPPHCVLTRVQPF